MRFSRVRSGLQESSHEVVAVALGADGDEIYRSGDVDQPLFYRSSIKPFQALATARAGADLSDEHLAVACASHGGYPAHLAIVDAILTDHGLTREALRCPPSLPLAEGAQRLQLLEGRTGLERRFHNCSGKHAGWLVGCTVAGWDVETYLDVYHPIQRSVCDILADLTGVDPMPVGVDGCGAPAFRGTVRALARGFHRLATDPEMGRIAWAMTRFGALVADNVRSDGRFGIDWGGPSKVGAEGLFAAGKKGITVVTKSLDGSRDIAVAAAIEVAALIGTLPRGTAEWLEPVAHPPVLGGGVPVGALELVDAH